MTGATDGRSSGRKWWFIVGGILCLNVLIFWLGYRKPPVLEQEELLPYGARLDVAAAGLSPYLSQDWRLLLVIVVPDKPEPKFHYIDILQREHQDRGPGVAALSGGTARQRDEVKERYDLSFPVAGPTDENVRGLRIDTSRPHRTITLAQSIRLDEVRAFAVVEAARALLADDKADASQRAARLDAEYYQRRA